MHCDDRDAQTKSADEFVRKNVSNTVLRCIQINIMALRRTSWRSTSQKKVKNYLSSSKQSDSAIDPSVAYSFSLYRASRMKDCSNWLNIRMCARLQCDIAKPFFFKERNSLVMNWNDLTAETESKVWHKHKEKRKASYESNYSWFVNRTILNFTLLLQQKFISFSHQQLKVNQHSSKTAFIDR